MGRRPALPGPDEVGIVMTSRVRRLCALGAVIAFSVALAGCLTPYEGGDSVCPGQGPNSPNWPYCHPSEPGGSQPADFPERL